MAIPIKMLRLSKGMEVGRVLGWLKPVGEPVNQDEAIVEVETEKSVVEVKAETNGVILEVIVHEGEEVPVGAVLGWYGQPGESVPANNAGHISQHTESSGADKPTTQQRTRDVSSRPGASGAGVRAAPAVRRLATARGINLQDLVGSGPGGRITADDVENAIRSRQSDLTPAVPHDEVERIPLTGIRKIMARRMAHSAHTYAAATTVVDVDMSHVQQMKEFEHVTYTSTVVKAAAWALGEHGILNSSLDGDEILLHKKINVAVAVDGSRGLTVVQIVEPDQKSLTEVDRELRDLAAQAKQGCLKEENLDPSTFTVTNSGVLGSLMFTPIINPPQSAVLGMGKVQETPVVRGGQVVVCPVMYLCLTYDHRVIEGAEAVRFLQTIKNYLEDPKEV